MNNLKMTSIAVFGLVLGLFLSQSVPALAQYYGTDSYKPVVVVDKKIKMPNESALRDNISQSEYLFKEGDQVKFTISIANKGNVALYDLNVVDTLPKYFQLQYFFGNLSDDKKSLDTKIAVLNPGENKTFYVIATISGLPKSETTQIIKEVNNVCVKNDSVSDCDKTVYFAGSRSMPTTGANDVMLINSFLLASLTGSAFALRKLVRGY